MLPMLRYFSVTDGWYNGDEDEKRAFESEGMIGQKYGQSADRGESEEVVSEEDAEYLI